MRNMILGSTAIILGMVATSAAAQYSPNSNSGYANPYAHQNNPYAHQHNAYGNHHLSVRIGQLQARLDEGVRTRSITRREASPIRSAIRHIASLERQYGYNGMSGQERSALQRRIRVVQQQLRRADDGAHGRYAHWDREDGHGWGTRNGGRADANRDGWDDRDRNRNGRWDDDVNYGYHHQQQQPPMAQPTGIAGLISSLLGGNALQVGQRVPSGLYGVPYQHQAHYRDGNGVYYRSDGRQIYQIDARTHTVTRVFAI